MQGLGVRSREINEVQGEREIKNHNSTAQLKDFYRIQIFIIAHILTMPGPIEKWITLN